MTPALMLNTQPAVILSLSIVTGPQAITLPLADLTPILLALWSFYQWLDRLAISAGKLAARVVFTTESSWQVVWVGFTMALILLLAIKWGACQKPLSKTPVKNSRSVFCPIQEGF